MVYFALQSFKQWSTCKVNSINYRYKKLVKTASNEVSNVINDLDSIKDGRVDLGLATDWYSVFLILDPIWRFVVVIV